MGITIQKVDIEGLVKAKIENYVSSSMPFTALEISNEIKKDGYHIRHREISGIVRDAYNYYVYPSHNYERSLIDVQATDWDEEKQANEQVQTEAYLYHPINYDPENYDLRTLVALPVNDPQTPKNYQPDQIDDGDTLLASMKHDYVNLFDFTLPEYNLDDIYSYKARKRSQGKLLISPVKLVLRSLTKQNFDLKITNKCVQLNVIEEKSAVNYTAIGEISIWKVILEMADLQDDTIWVHLSADGITIDNLHPIAKKFKRDHVGKITSFVAETPTSKKAAVQSVVLKINAVRKTLEGKYLCNGYNFKLVDGAVELEDTGRSYRLDRIFEDSVKILM